MCDYSLHGIENRLAVEGEVLVVYRFHTGSKGLTSPTYLESAKRPRGFMAFLAMKFAEPASICAVCIPDGARLVMTGISPAFQAVHRVSATENVMFRQLSADEAAHRDAVEFRNGVMLRLQDLDDNQRMEVLALQSDVNVLRRETLDTFSLL